MDVWLGVIAGIAVGFFAGLAIAGAGWLRHREPATPRLHTGDVHPQLRTMVGMLKAGGMVIGPHDEVLYSNTAARTLNLTRSDRIAVDDILQLVRECRRTQSGATTDLELSRGVGAPLVHLTVRVAPFEDGLVVVLADDRTPLMRVDETRRDFVANVSHELKTPIGAISLLSEAVAEAADDPVAVEHFAGRLRRESSRLTDLVSQIIELSRLQSADPMLGLERFEVNELVDMAIDRCRELATDRQVTIAETGDESLELRCDPARLADAVTNLLQNAIIYSDQGSRVAITYRKVRDADDEFVEVAVADNGIGIKLEDQQRIFERFYRVDYARSRESGGTGLGLSIVKHIAAIHGGTVNVWSRPGQGSTFTLRLPVVELDDEEGR